MRKLLLFMMVSLDGYFEGPDHDISWHNVDAEFNEFAIQQLDEIDTILFGRRTYELMSGYWPSEAALRDDPVVAGLMNSLPKIVFSSTLKRVEWSNCRLVSQDVALEIQSQKLLPGKDLAVFGSSDLAAGLAQQGLIDEFRIMVNPVLLGNGRTLLTGINGHLNFRLYRTRTFANGNALLYYETNGRQQGL
jgi:dihydrofolate reductase